jgi:hypothetical protein
MGWRWALVAVAILNIAAILGLMAYASSHPADYDRRIVWGLVAFVVVSMPVFIVPAFQRRIARGRPAPWTIGVGLVDLIEGLTGKEMSPAAQAKLRIVMFVLAVLALAGGLGLVLLRNH